MYILRGLVLVIIVIAIIVTVASSKNMGKNSSTNNIANDNYINYQRQDGKAKSSFVDNSNITDFQRQLQESTKTPQQVEDENWLKEKGLIANIAKRDFEGIKRKQLDKAKTGKYFDIDDHKCITVNYDCSHLIRGVDRQYSHNYTGKAEHPALN